MMRKELKERVVRRFVFIAAMLPLIASAAVYKCVDSSGKVTFSDRACDGVHGGAKVDVKPATGAGAPQRADIPVSAERRRITERFDRARDQLSEPRKRAPTSSAALRDRSTCKEFGSTELRTLIVRNQVVVGMTMEDASRAWGTPWRINGDQHAYHWEKGSAYFYIKGGCVTGVQGSYIGGKFVR